MWTLKTFVSSRTLGFEGLISGDLIARVASFRDHVHRNLTVEGFVFSVSGLGFLLEDLGIKI